MRAELIHGERIIDAAGREGTVVCVASWSDTIELENEYGERWDMPLDECDIVDGGVGWPGEDPTPTRRRR